MKKMNVKKGDTVKVLAGGDKGKSGKILRVLPKKSLVIVEGINLRKKHQRRTKNTVKGEIVERPAPIHVSNVAKNK